MGFWTANVLLLVTAVALISTVVSAGEVNPEDGNSASKIDQKFQQIFDRFDQLESMMKTIIRNQNELSGGSNNSGVTIGTEGATEHVVTHPELVATQNQLNLSLDQVDRLQNVLSDLVSLPTCQRAPARVYQPMVVTEANSSQNLSCQSPGQAVKTCLWGHNVNGNSQAILIDQQVLENGGRTTLDGITHAGGDEDFEAGSCTLNIGNVTEDHVGLWSCILILISRPNATISSAAVHLALASGNGTSHRDYQQRGTAIECEDKQMEFLTILKQVFDDGQNCAPCPKCDTTARGLLVESEEKLQPCLDRETSSSIYFVTGGGDLKAYSLETSQVSTIASPGGGLNGVAYDSMSNKIYFYSGSKIYRANLDGSSLETVLSISSSQFGEIQGMTFDWIVGNLYVVTHKGYIWACDARPTRTFTRATVLNNTEWIQGIALNPLEGFMYYTRYQPNKSIIRAGMDGSNPVTLVSASGDAYGIVIDFKASKLFWTDDDNHIIQSSNLQGGDRRTIVQLSNVSPHGIAFAKDRIYWGERDSKKLQRSTTAGDDITTLHTDRSGIWHLAVVPDFSLPRNRTNHCDRHSCEKVCVLTAASFRCLT